MSGKKTQRDAFWDRVFELAREDSDIVLVTADMGAPSLDKFRTGLAAQFINVGIAEQNAIQVATGMAMEGKKPFVYAIAPFITLRCLEQTRVSNSIMDIPITIVGVGAGFGYEDSGPTHHMLEDIAVMRSMPNIVINSVSDNVMARAVAEESVKSTHTNYVRLDRLPYDDIHSPGESFVDGVGVVREGGDVCVVATGAMVYTALDVAGRLDGRGVSVRVLDLYRLPVNGAKLVELLDGVDKVVTLEEAWLPGGMGSAVLEAFNDLGERKTVRRLGLDHAKGYSYVYGGRGLIHASYGIDVDGVERAVMETLEA